MSESIEELGFMQKRKTTSPELSVLNPLSIMRLTMGLQAVMGCYAANSNRVHPNTVKKSTRMNTLHTFISFKQLLN